jgi:stage III sporulation protein AE
MNKKLIFILIIVLMFFLFPFSCFAADKISTTVDITSLENFSKRLQQDIDYIPDISFSKMIDTYKSTGSIGLTFKDFANGLIKFIFQEVVGNSRLLVELLFIAILSAILQNIQNAFDSDGVSKIAFYACFLVMVIIIIKSFLLIIQLGQQTISSMIEFMNALMPSLLVLIAAVGGFASATTLDPVLMFMIKVSSDIIRDLVLPMTILVVILNIVDNLSDNIKVSKLSSLIKQFSLWTLGFVMTIFIAVITIRSSASATIDQVALKTAKFAVDNFIPVVGKALSDAVTTVAGYSLVLKDAVSIAGLIIMIVICIFPIIKIIIISLIYKFVGAVMEPVVDKKVVDCLSAAGSSLTIVFASVLSVAIMFFVMVTIIASTGRLVMMVR